MATLILPEGWDKPTTNADRIRAMSDEELAHFIDEFWSAAWCPDDPPVDPETKDCLMHDGNCELCILDWLKQEVEESPVITKASPASLGIYTKETGNKKGK